MRESLIFPRRLFPSHSVITGPKLTVFGFTSTALGASGNNSPQPSGARPPFPSTITPLLGLVLPMSSNSINKIRGHLRLSLSCLPSEKEVYFQESSFFVRYGIEKLPSPGKIRSLQKTSYLGDPPPMRFPETGLLVKFGHGISVAEGQCLWAIRRLLRNSVPVPELYGWIEDGDETFIYMELIDGDTLQERWDSLSGRDRARLCEELRDIITSLRRLEQSPSEKFIGRVGGQPLSDVTFSGVEAGPFPAVKDFNDWFSALPKQGFTGATFDDPFRSRLADDVPVCFTHGDLHPSNILITSSGTPHILALVDFHQSGWLPAYWEYCKALLTCCIGDEWETLYIPMFLEPYPDCFKAYSFYAGALGC